MVRAHGAGRPIRVMRVAASIARGRALRTSPIRTFLATRYGRWLGAPVHGGDPSGGSTDRRRPNSTPTSRFSGPGCLPGAPDVEGPGARSCTISERNEHPGDDLPHVQRLQTRVLPRCVQNRRTAGHKRTVQRDIAHPAIRGSRKVAHPLGLGSVARCSDSVAIEGPEPGRAAGNPNRYPTMKPRSTVRSSLSGLGSSSAMDCHVPRASRPSWTGTVSDGDTSSGST